MSGQAYHKARRGARPTAPHGKKSRAALTRTPRRCYHRLTESYSGGFSDENCYCHHRGARRHPATGAFVPGGVEEQAEQSLRNLKAVLAGAGCTLGDVVKTTVFLTDMGAFAAVNAVYAKYFEGDCPARSAVQVGALPKGALVEIEAIAVKK